MNNNNTCPPPPSPASCPTTSGCNLCPYSIPSQTSVCGAGSAGGGDLPNGPLEVPCPKNTSCIPPDQYCTLSPLARVIITVTQLRREEGVSEEEIFDYHNNILCPENQLTEAEVDAAVRKGLRQGALQQLPTGIKVYGFFGDLPSNMQLVQELGTSYQICLGLFC